MRCRRGVNEVIEVRGEKKSPNETPPVLPSSGLLALLAMPLDGLGARKQLFAPGA
jgi:hypothetical protein